MVSIFMWIVVFSGISLAVCMVSAATDSMLD